MTNQKHRFDEAFPEADCNLCENYQLSRCDGEAKLCNSYIPVRSESISYLLRVILGIAFANLAITIASVIIP